MNATRGKCAAFILNEAAGLGIRVGASNDGEGVMAVPARVPREVRCWFEIELYKYKVEIIEVILRENAGGLSSSAPPQITIAKVT
jgi:hypothetical protein